MHSHHSGCQDPGLAPHIPHTQNLTICLPPPLNMSNNGILGKIESLAGFFSCSACGPHAPGRGTALRGCHGRSVCQLAGCRAHALPEVRQVVHRLGHKPPGFGGTQSPGMATTPISMVTPCLSRATSDILYRCRSAVSVAARVAISRLRETTAGQFGAVTCGSGRIWLLKMTQKRVAGMGVSGYCAAQTTGQGLLLAQPPPVEDIACHATVHVHLVVNLAEREGPGDAGRRQQDAMQRGRCRASSAPAAPPRRRPRRAHVAVVHVRRIHHEQAPILPRPRPAV